MVGLLTALGLATKILPMVVELVGVVEAQVSAQGSGASKKELVMGIVSASAQEFSGELGIPPEKVTSIIDKVIDIVVAVFNKTGLFKKS